MHKITKYGLKILALYERFCPNTRIYGHARINTSDLVTLQTRLAGFEDVKSHLYALDTFKIPDFKSIQNVQI